MRDDFSQRVKLALAHRVAMLCSNPACRAVTSGPRCDASSVSNIGVAAHITAASANGPRYDPDLTPEQRRNARNGIWLCHNCEHRIDTEPIAFSEPLLLTWKSRAEAEARTRIGKTRSRLTSRSVKDDVAALRRDHKLRDDLHRDLLKSPPERLELPRMTSRASKFRHSEVIVHHIDDRTYPNVNDGVGISGWFKLEVLDFYHGGLEGILDLQHIFRDSETAKWCLISFERSKESYPSRLLRGKVFITGRIPWRDILYYDMRGDEYYPQPHLYCQFGNNGEPYEGRGFFLIGDVYEWELDGQNRMEFEELMELVAHEADTHSSPN